MKERKKAYQNGYINGFEYRKNMLKNIALLSKNIFFLSFLWFLLCNLRSMEKNCNPENFSRQNIKYTVRIAASNIQKRYYFTGD